MRKTAGDKGGKNSGLSTWQDRQISLTPFPRLYQFRNLRFVLQGTIAPILWASFCKHGATVSDMALTWQIEMRTDYKIGCAIGEFQFLHSISSVKFHVYFCHSSHVVISWSQARTSESKLNAQDCQGNQNGLGFYQFGMVFIFCWLELCLENRLHVSIHGFLSKRARQCLLPTTRDFSNDKFSIETESLSTPATRSLLT